MRRSSLRRRRVLGRPDESNIDPRISRIFKFLEAPASEWKMVELEYPERESIKSYPAYLSITFHFNVKKETYAKWQAWCEALLRLGGGLGLTAIQELKVVDKKLKSDWKLMFEVLVEDREHFHVRLFEAMQQLENMLKIVR